MKKLQLNQNQIQEILKIPDKFKKRDYIQELGIKYFVESKGKLLCTWATSTGKTVLAIKIIKKLRKKTDKEIHIVVPSLTLFQQWKKQIKNINDVFIYTINTYCKLNNPKPLLLIVDECHIGTANENSKEFNNINYFQPKYKLYLSATLKFAQKKYLEKSTKINTEFNIGIREAELLDLVPKFKVYNTFVSFTESEKYQFAKATDNYNYAIKYFNDLGIKNIPTKFKRFPTIVDPKTRLNITEKAKKIAYIYTFARNKRCHLIYTAEEKMKLMQEIYPLVTKKTIFFSKFKKQAEEIAKIDKENILVYHSGDKKKESEKKLESFLKNEYVKVSSVNKIIAGLDDKFAEQIIRHSFDSTEHSSIQSLGRILRVNSEDPDKAPVMINFIIRPFVYNNEDYLPMDNYWIKNSLKSIDYEEITIEELKTKNL